MKFEVEKIESFTGHKEAVYAISQSMDSSKFYSAAGDGMIVEWDSRIPDLGKPLASLPHSVYALHFDEEHARLWAGDNFQGVRIFDLNQRKELALVPLNKTSIFDIKTYKNLVFIAGGDGVITVLDREKMTFKKHIKSSEKSVRSLAINPVERELAAGYSDHYIRIFDLNTLELKKEIQAHAYSVFTLTYTPDYLHLISGSRDARLKKWDIEQNYALDQEVVAHMFTINHLIFSPSGTLFATCSMDKSIKLWNAENMKLLKVIDKARHAGHATSINRLYWLSDSELISASDDRSLSLWRISQY